MLLLTSATGLASAQVPKDIADIETKKYRVGKDEKKIYLLHKRKESKAPKKGYKLFVILPGGNGSATFQIFVKRILKNACSKDYIAVQPVAPKWHDKQQVVWPTGKNREKGQKFTTEKMIEDIIKDVRKKVKVDKKSIYCMAWSSSGPAVYAAALQKKTQVTGYFISQSVFRPQWLPDLKPAKGRRFFIEHSPEDLICPFKLAVLAKDSLTKAKAKVKFETYKGGHGWRGDVYGRIRKGVKWLEGK